MSEEGAFYRHRNNNKYIESERDREETYVCIIERQKQDSDSQGCIDRSLIQKL